MRIAHLLCTALILSLTIPLPTVADSATGDTAAPANLILILDASGSMWGQIEGENKIVIARRVLGSMIDDLPDGLEVGLVAYGHRREGDCDDIESVVALGPLDRAGLRGTVDALNPKGKTPITDSIEHAFEIVRGADDASTVVLVSDGLETCGGDPCAAVRKGKELGLDFRMHVVAFDIADDDVSQLECAAQAGGGLFLAAEDAAQLGDALETAVAQPASVPDGRLLVGAVTNGALQDVVIHVVDTATGEQAGGGRTYTDPGTNPRLVPLEPGTYNVTVRAVGVKGDIERRFENLVIADEVVEKHLDFSAGELLIGVTRNGMRSDATVKIAVAGEKAAVANGRTYTGETQNPMRTKITAGTYDVTIGSIEVASNPKHTWEGVVVPPNGTIELTHEYDSGTIAIGAVRGTTLIDATLSVIDTSSGRSVDQGRTYTSERTNPNRFEVPPGTYQIKVHEIRGDRRELTVTVGKGESVERIVDFDSEP